MTSHARRLIGAALAFLLLVSACATDDDQALPFDAVVAEVFGTSDIDAYRYDVDRDASRLLAECMRAAGWEYIERTPLPQQPTEVELASLEYVTENGFGIVSTFLAWLESDNLVDQRRDPNLTYLQTLTPDELTAYVIDLEGVEPPPGQTREDSGCQGQATAAFTEWERFFDALPQFTGMAEARDTHPDFVTARTDWQACMLDMGYDYLEPEVIRSDVTQRMSVQVAEVAPDGQLPIELVDGEWIVDPTLMPLLDEIAAFERSVALANHRCTETVSERFDAVELEVQQEFVDANQAIIDELLAGTDAESNPT